MDEPANVTNARADLVPSAAARGGDPRTIVPAKSPRFWLVDTTLRDGEQSPGVEFSLHQSLDIARQLAEIGVTEIEVGTPAMGSDEQRKMRQIASALPQIRCTAWCRARSEDLVAAARAKVPAVHVSVPVSEIQQAALGRDWDWVYRQLTEVIGHARRMFDYVSVGAQDASRCSIESLLALATYVKDLDADRFRISDTVGIWNPIRCYEVVTEVVEAVPGMHIGVHCHDDLGMATANAVVAIAAGASCVDVTVNGLGERAGNAALEEVVMALELSRAGSTHVKTRELATLSTLVANYARRPLPADKAIVGEGIFRHESGIHVHAMLRDPRTYEPFAPERVGHRDREFVMGKHSGCSAREHLSHIGNPQARQNEASAHPQGASAAPAVR